MTRALHFVAIVVLGAACGGTSTAPTASPAPTTPDVPGSSQQGCSRTSVGFTPLTDMGSAKYQGQAGGL